MPKHSDEHGVKSQRRKKSDKAKRNFELHGAYTQKHIRQQQALSEKSTRQRDATEKSMSKT